jgi:catechol 2,3-dioxygenase-like lactoylglutathione lyase family enzyme
MTLMRMDNVGIVVDDFAAAVAFFKELGRLRLQPLHHDAGCGNDRDRRRHQRTQTRSAF